MRRTLAIPLMFVLVCLAGMIGWATSADAAQPTKRPTDEQRGEELYRRHCVACHGVRNGGQGPATTAFVHAVPALQGKVNTKNDHIQVVLKGKGAMPGFEASFDRQDAVRVLKYMRSLGPDKALPDRKAKPADARRPRKPLPKSPAKPKNEQVPDGPETEGGEPVLEDNEDNAGE